jgi:hypothetical protein
MFARTLQGFALACLLAASPVLAVEEYQPFPNPSESEQAAPEIGIVTDKQVPEQTIATGSDSETPVDADG